MEGFSALLKNTGKWPNETKTPFFIVLSSMSLLASLLIAQAQHTSPESEPTLLSRF